VRRIIALIILVALIIAIALFCSLYLAIFESEGPEIEWSRTFDGGGSDWGYSVQQTSDGGYIIAGITYSYGDGYGDVYLIKTDSNGNLQWSRTFGGSKIDWGESVYQTADGGYIVVGEANSFGVNGSDVYLIKTDPDGNLLWNRTFGGENYDWGESVQQTADGGYIIVGVTNSFGAGSSGVYLIKTDSNGNMQWSKTFGGTRHDRGESIQQTSDGGYIIAGYTDSFGSGGYDVYLIKTDSSGNIQWNRTLGGGGDDKGYSVQQTSDGGYIIAGYTNSSGSGKRDVYLIKTDSNGNMQWSRTFGGSGDDTGWSVYQTSDGGYIIVGVTNSFGAGRNDVYLIKTDSNGNLQWSKTLGSSEDDVGFSVQQTDDGGYIIAGGTNSSKAGYDVWLIKLKSSSGRKTSAVFPLPLIALLIPLIYRGIAEYLGSYAWRNRSTGGSIEKVKNLTRKWPKP
jgi:hypothetical protein